MPTMSEQILSRVAGRPVRAGDVVTANVDLVMVHDSLAWGSFASCTMNWEPTGYGTLNG